MHWVAYEDLHSRPAEPCAQPAQKPQRTVCCSRLRVDGTRTRLVALCYNLNLQEMQALEGSTELRLCGNAHRRRSCTTHRHLHSHHPCKQRHALTTLPDVGARHNSRACRGASQPLLHSGESVKLRSQVWPSTVTVSATRDGENAVSPLVTKKGLQD